MTCKELLWPANFKELSRHALVAFAVRCAEHVESASQAAREIPDHAGHLESRRLAIQFAWKVAAGEQIPKTTTGWALRDEVLRGTDAIPWPEDLFSSDAKRMRAGSAAAQSVGDAARCAAWTLRSPYDQKEAISDAIGAAGWALSAIDEIDPKIVADYDLLRSLPPGPVSREVFGPKA